MRQFCFYFTGIHGERDVNAMNMVRLFRSVGLEPDLCDTVPIAFSLNRNWWYAYSFKTFRDYGYTLPVSKNIDALVEIVELVESNRVIMMVEEVK